MTQKKNGEIQYKKKRLISKKIQTQIFNPISPMSKSTESISDEFSSLEYLTTSQTFLIRDLKAKVQEWEKDVKERRILGAVLDNDCKCPGSIMDCVSNDAMVAYLTPVGWKHFSANTLWVQWKRDDLRLSMDSLKPNASAWKPYASTETPKQCILFFKDLE